MQFKNMNGQGLIEVMMTLLVIAGCVIALLRFQNYLAYSSNLANQQATASQLANSRMETLRDYSALTGSNSYANIASGNSTSTISNASYTTTWTVTSFANPTYKNIDITVTWTDQYGGAQSKLLSGRVSSIDPSYSATVMAI